jgi:putative nucleotidyltransferase with HDIG domain
MQEGPKHDRIYDIGDHSLLSLKTCPSPDPLVRFAALIHDVGKPDTFDTQEDGNVTFYAHDVVGARIAKKIGERLKLSRKEIDKLEILVRYHMFTVTEEQTDAAIRRFIKNIGLENIDDMIAVRIADRLGGGTETAVSWRMEEFRKRIDQVLEKPFSISDLKITGTDIMESTGLKPSREVGNILQKLFNEVLEDNSKNNREYLLQRVKEIHA